MNDLRSIRRVATQIGGRERTVDGVFPWTISFDKCWLSFGHGNVAVAGIRCDSSGIRGAGAAAVCRVAWYRQDGSNFVHHDHGLGVCGSLATSVRGGVDACTGEFTRAVTVLIGLLNHKGCGAAIVRGCDRVLGVERGQFHRAVQCVVRWEISQHRWSVVRHIDGAFNLVKPIEVSNEKLRYGVVVRGTNGRRFLASAQF